MKLFCCHDYRPHGVIYGESLIGVGTWAITFHCVKCNRRRLDVGWSEQGARRQLEWLKAQRRD